MSLIKISEIRHPHHLTHFNEWQEWRDTFEGGKFYLDNYLRKFSDRETDTEFQARKDCTPIPTFAKSAILDVRNSIFQRLNDVSRIGGSEGYQKAVAGEAGGIDRKGSSMNSFVGIEVLTELLIMGRCGVFVDNTASPSVTLTRTLADTTDAAPFCYYYPVESILSYTEQEPDQPGSFKAVLLKDNYIQDAPNVTGIPLPSGAYSRYRLLWIGGDGYVYYRMYDEQENPVLTPESDITGAIRLELREIPFHLADIGDSLLKDTASYQKALLNLGSTDVNYALKSNVPFLTIQADLRTAGAHLKKPSVAGDATAGGQTAQDNEERIGAGTGRYYDRDTNAPQFIAPPTEPLKASMELQERLEDNIRRLINLAVENKVGSRTESAESKKMSAQGLEAGLSFIGLVLEETERQIAKYMAAYENPESPTPATVSYPTRYILKTDEERLKDADAADKLAQTIPSTTAKKVSKKQLALALFGNTEPVDILTKIENEIEASPVSDARFEAVLADKAAGLVSDESASEARGYAEGEVEQAAKDKADNIALTLQAQMRNSVGIPANAASRGATGLDSNPNSGKQEQAAGRAAAKAAPAPKKAE